MEWKRSCEVDAVLGVEVGMMEGYGLGLEMEWNGDFSWELTDMGSELWIKSEWIKGSFLLGAFCFLERKCQYSATLTKITILVDPKRMK